MLSADSEGNLRTVPVLVNDGPHRGLIVWHSLPEYERLTGEIVCLGCGEPIAAHEENCPLTKRCVEEC